MTEYYLFATFVFILCLGMLIVMKFVFKIDKSDGRSPDLKEKEAKVLNLYGQIEDMMEGFEEYAEEVKTEISAVKSETEKFSKSSAADFGDNEKLDALITEILDKKLDNKVSEAVRRIVARTVKEEMEIAVEDILKRIESIEKKNLGNADTSQGQEFENFVPQELVKTPDTLEELDASIEKAMKSKSDRKSAAEKKIQRKKVIELYNSGMGINDIAKEVGIASSEIKLIIEFLN